MADQPPVPLTPPTPAMQPAYLPAPNPAMQPAHLPAPNPVMTSTASSHRLLPVAPPGQDIVTLLRQREAQGHVLALLNLLN